MDVIKKQGKLYLIPAKLGDSVYEKVLPNFNKELILSIDTFIVEDLRLARRFLKSLKYPGNFDNVCFHILNEHTKLPITNKYETGATLGKDRIAAAVGAYTIFPENNVLAIDAGTALTWVCLFLNRKKRLKRLKSAMRLKSIWIPE